MVLEELSVGNLEHRLDIGVGRRSGGTESDSRLESGQVLVRRGEHFDINYVDIESC